MLENMLVLIAVMAAMVGIIINRKSLTACVVITVVSALLCSGFLALYANSHKLGSYNALLTFTIIGSVALILVLLAVTYIGVKMFFKKEKSSQRTYAANTSATTNASGVTAPTVIAGIRVNPTPVGIFGRQPIKKPVVAVAPLQAEAVEASVIQSTAAAVVEQTEAVTTPSTTTVPVAAAEPAIAVKVEEPVKPDPKEAALVKMLSKADSFMAAEQYVLAEQMYNTYIQRCPDGVRRANAEIMLVRCRIIAGDRRSAQEQLGILIGKLRSGEYELTAEQKQQMAECRLDIMKM